MIRFCFALIAFAFLACIFTAEPSFSSDRESGKEVINTPLPIKFLQTPAM